MLIQALNHTFGMRSYTDSDPFNGQMVNVVMVDGERLMLTPLDSLTHSQILGDLKSILVTIMLVLLIIQEWL